MQTFLMITIFSITFQSKLLFDVSRPSLNMDGGGKIPNSCLLGSAAQRHGNEGKIGKYPIVDL